MEFKTERKCSTIEEFTRSYVSRALEVLSEGRTPLVLDEWESTLRKKVSKDTGLSQAHVVLLHHPFHWTFFSNSFGLSSPLRLFYSKGGDSNTYVQLEEEITPEKIEALVNHIQLEYGPIYLGKRVSEFNIPLQ